MFDVNVSESPDKYRIAVKSTLSLDDSQLATACERARARPVICHDAGESGSTHYQIDLPKSAWRWGSESLKEEVLDSLLGMASHKLVWEVDGPPFPNQATKVLWEMMKRGTPGTKHELGNIRAEWVHDVRSDEELRRRTVVQWVDERGYESRLKDSAERRLLLIGWIDSFLTGGLEVARRYATRNHLVQSQTLAHTGAGY